MNISTTSWHYKFLTNTLFWLIEPTYPSRNLCNYFWQVVLRLVQGFALVSVAVSPVFTILYAWLGTSLIPTPDEFSIIGVYIAMMTLFGGAMIFIGILFGATWTICTLLDKNPQFTEKFANNSSLVFNYAKAKKERVCPIIEFTDTEENK